MPSAIPPASALSTYIQSRPGSPSCSSYHHALALQIQHNLQYQHDWTSLRVHSRSPLNNKPLTRPLISGLPPHRVYVHPDDQIEELKNDTKGKEPAIEWEWVLPTHLQEKWSLRKFAEVFDSIGEEPPIGEDRDPSPQATLADGSRNRKKRKGGKRFLLATLGDDSTIVYYIVHDEIVKPRQN